MAQFYGITDIDALPVRTLATLAAGLPADARSIRKITEQKVSVDTMLLAVIADRLGTLCWMQSKDGQKNRNRPKSILNELLKDKKENEYVGFDSIEAYEAARARILRKGETNG